MRKVSPFSLFFALFTCLFVYKGLCQSPIPKQDSLKVRTALANFEQSLNTDPKKAKAYLDEAKAHVGNNVFLTGITTFFEAKYEDAVRDNHSGQLYLKAYSLLRPIGTKEAYSFSVRSLFNRAVELQVSDIKQSLTFLLKAAPLAEKSGDSTLVSIVNSFIGVIFKNNGDYEKSIPYLTLSAQYTKKKNYKGVVDAYVALGSVYNHMGKAKEARQLLDKAKAVFAFLPPSFLEKIDYYQEEGLNFSKQNKYREALATYDKGIAMAKNLNSKYYEHGLLNMKSIVLFKMKDYAKAASIMLYISKQDEFMSAANNRMRLFANLAETYMAMNKLDKAYEWQKKYSVLSDSINNSRLKAEINTLEIKYRDVENKKKIAALQFANSEAELNAQNNRLLSWLLGSMSVFLLTIGVFSFVQFRNKKKLAEQKELNYLQEIREMMQQQELALMKAILQGEERERNRVARDLHDGLGGLLAGVKFNLSAIAATNGYEMHQHIHTVIKQLDGSVSELRRISHNLMPETLTKFGLDAAIRELVDVLSQKDMLIDYQSFELNDNVQPQTQTHIYRIVQELLTNAVRHSQASHIVLQCSQNKTVFLITIEDNGTGFDPETVTQGMGLKNIRNRIQYLKGNYDMRSEQNKGTTINIELNVT